MIASAQTLRKIQPVVPFVERAVFQGMTYGLGPCGYDIRIREDAIIYPGELMLASSLEQFFIPNDMMGVVHDKSTWARRGIAVQNTVLEPGWKGFLTLEVTNHNSLASRGGIHIAAGSPIAQVVFHILDEPTDIPYRGKYQNQPEGPQPAIFESDSKSRYFTSALENGLVCAVCKEPQYETPSGATCKNGHGGEEGIRAIKAT